MISLALIGGGNMGSAIVRGALRAAVFEPAQVLVIEPDNARRAALGALGCPVASEPGAARDAPAILLAVKPQVFPAIAAALAPRGATGAPTIVMSIMAGIGSATIREAIGTRARVLRIMPNTPCQIGRGMTAIALGSGARAGDEAIAQRIFSAVGRVVTVDESLIDGATAVSGSGPAYVFFLAEAMEEAARELGFGPAEARLLVQQTLVGAASLLAEGDNDPAALRAAVTSKGGTTEAALRVFAESGVRDAIVRALVAARDRGRELAR
ncbi:MAG: pyrroline-5-carboxylate reductase [Phycisphaerales bacterium]